jgi:hypothetical protein
MITTVLRRSVVGESAAPHLALSLVTGWQLVSDRLDRTQPLEGVGIVTALGRLLRPSKRVRHGDAMSRGGVNCGLRRGRGHPLAADLSADATAVGVLGRSGAVVGCSLYGRMSAPDASAGADRLVDANHAGRALEPDEDRPPRVEADNYAS